MRGFFAFTDSIRLTSFAREESPPTFCTLSLRVERHASNAMELAIWLQNHPNVQNVSYPGLESDPYHELAKIYLTGRGMGCMIMFSLKGGFDEAVTFINSLAIRPPAVFS